MEWIALLLCDIIARRIVIGIFVKQDTSSDTKITDAILVATANCSIWDKKKHLNAHQKDFLHGKAKNSF
jgi:hypothetical protein